MSVYREELGAHAVATVDECRVALEQLVSRLGTSGGAAKSTSSFDRTLSCYVPDLDMTFSGRLSNGHVSGLTTEPSPKAQIRLTAASDDLVALTDGRLAAGDAWKTGRLKVQAAMMDLLKLKSMF